MKVSDHFGSPPRRACPSTFSKKFKYPMITITIDGFRPDDIEREILKLLQADAKKRLKSGGISDVAVKITKKRGEYVYSFSGRDAESALKLWEE